MSEQYKKQQEQYNYNIDAPEKRHHLQHEYAPHHEADKQPKAEQSKEQIYKKIEQHAVTKDAHVAHKPESAHHERPHHYITQTIKRGVYAHTLKNVQTHLRPSERAFSKIVHNDTIETISELGAGTVARPGAILGGGVFMVFGGLALLLVARHYGFVIPLSSLLALYVIGFVLLFIIDATSKTLFKRSKKQRN